LDANGVTLLTGATGLFGRYLLRDLSASGRRLAVLARDTPSAPAERRVQELLALWADVLGRELPAPVVVAGDLREPGLSLGAGDRSWLGRHCRAVVHAAADVALRPAPGSDPWATNVGGTQRLLELCGDLGVAELHHVSTAFVCGDRAGPVREDELDCGQGFRNEYERSKYEAERWVRAARGLRATVYRPSIIVGDSRTGYTSSYHGLYRFLGLAARLAGAAGRLRIRLPFAGDETRNLVPVDWVARALTRLANRPRWHGQVYHLTAHAPVRIAAIRRAAEEVLGVRGVRWGGPGPLREPTPPEEAFLGRLREFWPYFGADPEFDCRNTRRALPRLPPPRVGRALLRRLIGFAVADRWGDGGRRPRRGAAIDCAAYVERFLPASVPRSTLARLPLDVTVGLVVGGDDGGRWSFRCRDGAVQELRRGDPAGAEVVFRMDAATFEDVVLGRQTPQDGFLARRIEIEGDVEKALKLAVLFGHFVRECPYAQPHPEATDAALVPA
jgi:nucleoside-diphosphate-sugar epimerase